MKIALGTLEISILDFHDLNANARDFAPRVVLEESYPGALMSLKMLSYDELLSSTKHSIIFKVRLQDQIIYSMGQSELKILRDGITLALHFTIL